MSTDTSTEAIWHWWSRALALPGPHWGQGGRVLYEAQFKKESYLRGIFYDYMLSSTLNEVISSLSINVADKVCFLSLPPLGLSVQFWVSMFCLLPPLFTQHPPHFAVKGGLDQISLRVEIPIHPVKQGSLCTLLVLSWLGSQHHPLAPQVKRPFQHCLGCWLIENHPTNHRITGSFQ